MGMYTHVMLNVPLINDQKDGAKFIEDNQTAVKNNTGHGVHGLPWPVAQAMLYQADDSVFLSQSKVHYNAYDKHDPKRNHMVLFTMDVQLKNYNQTIEKFLSALSPYILGNYYGEAPLFLGTIQDEDDFMPTLIFFDNDQQKIVFKPTKYLDN